MARGKPEARLFIGMENPKIDSSKKIHAMLIGAAGAGKSSLINSLIKLYEFGDESPTRKYTYVPTARSQHMGGHSKMREPVELTDNLTIIDNRGWHNWGNEAAVKELIAQIHGERTYDEDVAWSVVKEGSSTAKYRSTPRVISDEIDCITIVINGEGGIGAIENLDILIETCRKNTRRLPTFVITHKDKISGEQIEQIKRELELQHDINPDKIFVIKNVTKKKETLDAESKASLSDFIEECLADGEAGAAFHRRQKESLLKEEKLEKENTIKEIATRKLEAEIDKLEIDKIHRDLEAIHKKEREIKQTEMMKQQAQHEEEIQDLNKDKVKKLNKLKIEHSQDFHDHHLEFLEQYYKDLARNASSQ